MLHPRPDRRQTTAEHPRLALLQAYLRVNGPTTKRLYRGWVEGGTGVTDRLWEEIGSVVRVSIDGKRYDLPEDLVEPVTTAPTPRGVVLVPPHDPYLRQVDRTLLVPDSKQRSEVWRALSAPGALLVDGEVAGTWRYRRSDHELTITPFDTLSAPRRKQAAASAGRLASATGDDQPTLSWS